MTSFEIGSLVIGGIGGIGGIVGFIALFQTHRSNELSQDANCAAEEANRIATDSERLSKQANDIACKANEIAADANAISQRALSVTADQTVYKWRIEYDGETSTVFLINDCANSARDVQVFVRGEDQTITQGRIDEMAPFGEFPLESELFAQKIAEDRLAIDRLNSTPGLTFLDVGTCHVTVHIVYTTELGSRRSDEIKHGLTAGQRH